MADVNRLNKLLSERETFVMIIGWGNEYIGILPEHIFLAAVPTSPIIY